ncbi:MAG: D-alanyl-D-alanine carboxypeptidase [Ruminococcaceae bacterium]|nr:D-alanyl-D-alanine carboxypeptidase [Oscillospiraceae bacterium]
MKKRLSVLFASLFALMLVVSPVQALYGNEPEISAPSALLYEKNSGQIIYEHDARVKMYPASTTKVLTALLLLENCELDEEVTVTASALSAVPPGSSIAGLRRDEVITVYDLLVCLLVPSGNDAANVAAEHVSGSIEEFVKLMNNRAKQLGCKNTNFVNPSGYHDDNHYTTAYDLLLMTLAALEYDTFADICGAKQKTIAPTNIVEKERIFNSTNFMISSTETSAYLYEYCTGIKTGHTTAAGRCLIASAEKDGIELISVLLGAETRYTDSGVRQIRSFMDTEDLFDWGFRNFSYRTIVKTTDPVAEVKVNLSANKDYVMLTPEKEIRWLLHKNENLSDFEKEITAETEVQAPVEAGQVLGQMTVKYKGKVIETMNLLASSDVERSDALYALQRIQDTLSQPWVGMAMFGIVIAVILYITYMVLHNRRRQRILARRRRNQNKNRSN